jgi:protein SCO1/2
VASGDYTIMNVFRCHHDRFALHLLLSSLIFQGAGCGRSEPSADLSPSQGPAAATTEKKRDKGTQVTDYPLKGIVKKVDLARGSVMIAHEEIKGFMAAMTMPFFISDRAVLEDLAPGDLVEGTLHVEAQEGVVENYELRDLVVVNPAVRPMVLDVTKGKVSLREAPKLLEVGDPVPDFSMTTQEGKPLKLSDLRGSVIVLTFIYTRCPLPDFCPLMDRKFAELSSRISASRERAGHIRLISLSFDPGHDTPEVLAKHAQARGATPPLWIFAVSKHEELNKIARPLGLIYGPRENDIAHNLCTAIIDPQGKLARLELGTARNKWENVDLLKSIYSLIPPSPHAKKP